MHTQSLVFHLIPKIMKVGAFRSMSGWPTLEGGSSPGRPSRLASLVSKRPAAFERRTWLRRGFLTRDTKDFSYPLLVRSPGIPGHRVTVDVVLRSTPTHALRRT